MTSYQDYVDALIPANRRGRLKKQLDFDHGDNDDDLREIAKYITDWEIKLVTSLGLAPHEITDIKSAGALPLQRVRVLKVWKEKKNLKATYENLLKACLAGGDSTTAQKICTIVASGPPEGAAASGGRGSDGPGQAASSNAAIAVEFSENFSPKELAAWLRNKFVKKEICEIIEKEEIAGRVFSTIPEDEWKEDYGIKRGADRRMLTSLQEEIKGTVTNSPAPARGSDGGIPQKPHQKPGGTTRVHSHHTGTLVEQLQQCIAEWRTIAQYLGFKPYEISNITADPMKLIGGPSSYLWAVLERWYQFAPGDHRGSKEYATLEALKSAVDRAGFGDLSQTLHL